LKIYIHLKSYNYNRFILSIIFFLSFISIKQINAAEIPRDTTIFSGSVGLTTNGFSIIPSFSLNSPAIISVLSLRKNKFSFAPDVRLTPDLKKGGMIFWLRYQLVDSKKFSLRAGAHPALNIQLRDITTNGKTTTISQMRRFAAWELAPNFKLTKNWTLGIYYLNGNGLQLDGPRTTHFVTLNTSISKIKITKNLRFNLFAAVFHLDVDGNRGQYFTATGSINHTKSPFALESSINKTFQSKLPGNKDFMWNLSLNYLFSKKLIRLN